MNRLLIVAVALFAGGIVSATHAREIFVKKGESLTAIAARELGSMDRWEEIARLNGIADPRRLREGQRLRIPGTEAAPEPAPMPMPVGDGRAAVRALEGAVRLQAAPGAGWQDLAAPVSLASGAWLKTANTGRAEMAIGNALLEVGPFSIVEATEVDGLDSRTELVLHLGEIEAWATKSVIAIRAKPAVLRLQKAEARVTVDDRGALHVLVFDGRVDVWSADGRKWKLAPGSSLMLRSGQDPHIDRYSPSVMLQRPADSSVVSETNVLFEWSAVKGAKWYRLVLRPEAKGKPSLEQRVDENRLLVRGVPLGRYSWQVRPIGMRDALPSMKGMLEVASRKPAAPVQPVMPVMPIEDEEPDKVEVTTRAPEPDGSVEMPGTRSPMMAMSPAPDLNVLASPLPSGMWRLMGMTAPNAWVKIGTEEMQADRMGNFQFDMPMVKGLVILGVEARTSADGRPARFGVALMGRPEPGPLMSTAIIPTGRVMISGRMAPAEIPVGDGRTSLEWQWEVGPEKAAEGTAEIMIDRAPPEILAISSDADKILTGEEITLTVAARDIGSGLGPASSANISVVGPSNFSTAVKASMLTKKNEYVFKVPTPSNMDDGMIRVTRVEIADGEGNSTVISTEGLATETKDGSGRARKFLVNLLLLGAGIAIGTGI